MGDSAFYVLHVMYVLSYTNHDYINSRHENDRSRNYDTINQNKATILLALLFS